MASFVPAVKALGMCSLTWRSCRPARSGSALPSPGDLVDLWAETDVVVDVTACPAEKSNDHALEPIDPKAYG